MLANRRAVRPDGKHYRTSRRRRALRAYRNSGDEGLPLIIYVLVGVAVGLIYLGFHLGGMWTRLLCFVGAVIALVLIIPALIIKK